MYYTILDSFQTAKDTIKWLELPKFDFHMRRPPSALKPEEQVPGKRWDCLQSPIIKYSDWADLSAKEMDPPYSPPQPIWINTD